MSGDDVHGPPIGLPPDVAWGPMQAWIMSTPWHMVHVLESNVWDYAQGEGETIAILDTGVSAHPDLPEPEASKSFIGGESPDDPSSGHGTHCAGTALGRNGIGVAPKAKLIRGKVLSNRGSGGSDGIAAGIRWAADNGATIISMSLGGGGPYRPTEEAIAYAWSKGIFVNAAAGNAGYNGSNTIGYPSKYDICACCGATQKSGKIANFSSGGRQIDWAGPGQEIISCNNRGSGYRTMSGTCIAEGEYVYGPQGPKKIETVQPGDVVYAWKDKQMVERVVLQNHFRGVADTILINAGGRDVRVTPTHQILAVNRALEPEWVEAQHLHDSKYRALLPRQFTNQVNPYLDAQLDEEICWLLGFFAGDGWVSETSGGLRVCFAEKVDEWKNERVAELYNRTTGKALKYSKTGRWSYDDSTMTAMVVQCLGLRERSQSKDLPLFLWNLARPKQVAFYQGYLASDGHVTKAGGQSFECTSQSLIRRMACLHDYLGYKHGRCRSRSRFGKAPNQVATKWTTSHCLTANWGSTVDGGWSGFCGTKSKGADETVREAGIDTHTFYSRSFQLIDEVQTASVYDLTVPDADCFVTQGVITHNSMSTPYLSGTAALLREMMRRAGRPLWKSMDEFRASLGELVEDRGPEGPDVRYGQGVPVFDAIITAIARPDLWA